MTALARRQDIDVQYECWHVYYGDVRVGTIAKRIGIPPGEDPWGWACGFYPGRHPREQAHGTAAPFDQARAEFDEAWRVFLSNRTEVDFDAWRKQCDWSTWKYAMRDAGRGTQVTDVGAGLAVTLLLQRGQTAPRWTGMSMPRTQPLPFGVNSRRFNPCSTRTFHGYKGRLG